MPVQEKMYEFDEHYLHRLIPDNLTIYFNRKGLGGEAVMFRVNKLGLRGEEINNPARGKRVIVYGDSFIEAKYAAVEDTFVKRLEQHLRKDGYPDIEVLNAGIAASGPDQSYLRMTNEIDILQPDLVLFAIFSGNDYGDLMRNKLFLLDQNGELIANKLLDTTRLRKHFDEKRHLFGSEKIENRSALVRIIKNFYWHWHRLRNPEVIEMPVGPDEKKKYFEKLLQKARDEYESYIVDNNYEVARIGADLYDADISLTPDSPSAKYKVRLIGQLLKRIHETAVKTETALIVVIIPAATDACDNYEDSVESMQFPSYDREALTRHIEDISVTSAIPYVNLFKHFREAVDCNALYLHDGDGHWNPAGQEFSARIVKRFLLDQEML